MYEKYEILRGLYSIGNEESLSRTALAFIGMLTNYLIKNLKKKEYGQIL